MTGPMLRDESTEYPSRLTREQRDHLAAAQEPGWCVGAPCAEADPDAWFPDPGSVAPKQAYAICQSCPLRKPCLAAALLGNERGVWAGTTAYDRGFLHRLLDAGYSAQETLALGLGTPRRELPRLVAGLLTSAAGSGAAA